MFYARRGVEREVALSEVSLCRHCGGRFTFIRSPGGRGARPAYCSDGCRRAVEAERVSLWAREKAACTRRQRLETPRFCVECGGEYRAGPMGHIPKLCPACRQVRDLVRMRADNARRVEPVLPRPCVVCGFEFTPLQKRTARFCSQACVAKNRRKEHPAVRVETARGRQEERDCELCGERFMPRSPLTKFCSKQCGQRGTALRKTYGLDPLAYRAMLEAQESRCASCSADLSGDRVLVDHCHTTGKVRGLVCSGCNIAAGHIEKRGDVVSLYLARSVLDLRELCLQ